MNHNRRFSLPGCLIMLCIGIAMLLGWDLRQVEGAPIPDVWQPGPDLPLPDAFYGFTQCADQPNSFYVVAGWQAWYDDREEVWRFYADTGYWANLSNFPEEMSSTSVTCYQGYLYAAGGNLEGDETSDHLYSYDIANNVWTQLSNLPRPQNGAALAAWDGYLYMLGGDDAPAIPISPTTQVDRYNIWTDTWEANWGEPMPSAALGSWLQAGKYVYYVGGYTENFPINSNDTLRFDLSTNSWDRGPSFISRRAMAALAITGTYLYAIGGDQNGGSSLDPTSLAERLDLGDWPGGQWVDIGDPIPQPLIALQGACTSAYSLGEIWTVGGVDAFQNVVPSVNHRVSETCANFFFGDLPREDWTLASQPGESAHYVMPLVNNGTLTDTFTIEFSSNWVITAPLSIGPIGAGMTDLLMVNIEVPDDALPDDFDIATITVTSKADTSVFDNAVLTTSVSNWSQAASAPINVAFQERAQCANDPNGFYALGGSTPDLGTINDVNYYSATSNIWTPITHLPRGGGWGSIGTCYDNKLYIIGSGFTHIMDVYDLATDTWTYGLTVAPLDPYGSGIGVWDGELFMVGGTGEVNIYNIADNTWSDGPAMPAEPLGFGNVQAGQYLYVVGGFSGDWIYWNDNLDITLRLSMADKVWETGPSFPSRRGVAAIAVSEAHLYAIGGDINGGERLDPTGLVEVLDLSQWQDGEWEAIGQNLPWALEANWGGSCTEARSGGEIWSVGGASGTWKKFITINDAYYLPTGEACVQNIVNLPDEPRYGEGKSGESVNYTFTITNTGNITDYFRLTISSTWPFNLAKGGPGPIGPGETLEVVVGIDIPVDVPADVVGHSIVHIESLRDPNIMDELQIYTTVLPTYVVKLEPDTLEGGGMHGETLGYTLTVSNAGNITDTISLSYTGNTWDVYTPVTTYTLAMGESAEVIVYVTIPSEAMLGDSDTVTLVVTSREDPMAMDSAVLTTKAFWYQIMLPISMKN